MDKVHWWMRRQWGLVTRDQATAAGLSAAQIRARLDSGEWRRVRVGVYAHASSQPTWEQAALAAVLAAEDGVVSHASAEHLWCGGRRPDQLELLVPRERRLRIDGVVAHRSGALFDDDRTSHRRIPVVTFERMLVELSATLDATALGRLTDIGLRRRLVRLDRLRRCVGRLEGAPGRRPDCRARPPRRPAPRVRPRR